MRDGICGVLIRSNVYMFLNITVECTVILFGHFVCTLLILRFFRYILYDLFFLFSL